MILLDAYALVAFVADEPAADEVNGILRDGTAAITSVNLAEALDVLWRVVGLPPEEVESVLRPLLGVGLGVVAVSEPHAWRAARLRHARYDRRARPVSMADCVLLAAAESEDQIATSDPDVADVARAEGVPLIALADTAGRRP